MAQKKVLGRGLGAFFPEYNSDEPEETGTTSAPEREESKPKVKDPAARVNVVLSVPVEHIRANPNQPRTDFNQERLEELAESIKTHGIIQPITVRYLGEKRFELISGERRLRATKLAGLDEIPAYIREADDEQSMAFALIEN
ncbi:MAG: ParB N-terminal domain-containing protein, partial [Bacteroidota bacterium]